ncbi:outer membrane beta-barrel protein [Pedobacter petrophilus]|uniref:Outer membrane beta-barrel protein n=1 Tax=Pedobacter petrophilus TaxID=1908241 RepID=A0A7K0FTH8_9SPHI|nr:TonB-dependent receptor [Pedobacter petrophilus]MRX74632.1 outer membrane beta-barrel protein [Pedobacter petrophilus]
MKSILTLFVYISLFHISTAWAQNKAGIISGTILNDLQNPVAASVKLSTINDSSFLKITLTDEYGKFHFDELKSGQYTLQITSLGYRPAEAKFQISDSIQHVVRNIIIQTIHNDLGSVTIARKKPVIERFNDRTVMNVENSLVSTGSNALEILAKMPGVSVNQEGTISVRGKSGVNVLINGKSTFLSSEQLATLLKSLNGNEIKAISLITNPSSKYDAAGSAGIIDIRLKKNASFGTNGNLDGGFGYGKQAKSNIGISLNHRNKNVNIFGSLNNNNNKAPENLEIERIVNDGISNTFFQQFSTQNQSTHNNSYKAGIDYFLNDKNTIGMLTSGYFNNGHDHSDGLTNIGSSFTKADSSIIAESPSANKYRNQAYNLNYKSVIDTLGQELSADVDYAHYRSEENTVYNNYFSTGNGSSYRAPLTFRNSTPSSVKIKAAKLDYSLPLTPKTKLDLGLKTSWVSTDNDFKFENFADSRWQNDPTRSNRFIYKENINAAYANFKQEFKSTGIEIGLRAEQTNSEGNSISEQKIVKRSYLNFFPNLIVSQKLSALHTIGFSYSRRIDRPDYKSLNPFVYFVDLYTFAQGNPFLNPQYTHAFELSYNHNKTLNITLGYSHTDNLILDVFLPDNEEKTLYQTVQNLDERSSYNLTIGYPTTISKFWTMDNTVTSNYNLTRSASLAGLAYDRKKVTFSINSNQNFIITPTLSAEISADFISAQIYGTYAIKPYYGIDFGIKKTFPDTRLNLKFALNDVLNSRKANISSALSNLNYNLIQKQETRIFRISLGYAFGSSAIKATRNRNTSVTDEENRIK